MHHTPSEFRILAFLRGVTRQGLYLRAHVHSGIGAPDLLDVDDRRDPLDERAVPLLGLPQLSLRLLAFGDVADHAGEQSLPILVGLAQRHLDRELATVFAQPYQLGRAAHHARFARSEVAVQPDHAEFAISFGHKERDRLPDDLFCPVAEGALRPAVEPPDQAVRRYGHDRVEGRVQNGAVARLALSQLVTESPMGEKPTHRTSPLRQEAAIVKHTRQADSCGTRVNKPPIDAPGSSWWHHSGCRPVREARVGKQEDGITLFTL